MEINFAFVFSQLNCWSALLRNFSCSEIGCYEIWL